MYFFLAWVIPQDLESFKYLEGYLLRNKIPFDRIGHEGWINNDLQKQIKFMEVQEISRSQMRPAQPPIQPAAPPIQPNIVQAPVQPINSFGNNGQSAAPGMPQNFSQTPEFGGPSVPAPPLPTCTQAELGIEQGIKYGDDFEKDLAFLKDDINKQKGDPVTSHFFEEATRRQPIDPKAVEEFDFFKALDDLKKSKFTPGQPLGNDPTNVPGATQGYPGLAPNRAAQSEFVDPATAPKPKVDISPLSGTKIFSSEFGKPQQGGQPLPTAGFPVFPGQPVPTPVAPIAGYNMSVGPKAPATVPVLASPPIVAPQPNHRQQQQTSQSYVAFLRSVGV